MTRPLIVRADTIDLQDHSAPSAKDHHNAATNEPGHIAPHQAETLREVAHETAEEETRSPRGSWNTGDGKDLQHYVDELAAIASGHPAGSNMARLGQQQTQQQQQQQQQPPPHKQQDDLAIAQNGGASSDEGDLDDEDLDDDMMDKISSSPSIEDEDIDFDFVYALHTFVATVEGQANATKGDTMVLLDDSNSYWWLVRVVKDSSIGYLPAEHIETPTERLARLNKHRNIDLSATMLGDQAAKQKNSFKGIRRRRKTVSFADPTYVDYSDYSSDEEDIEELFGEHVLAGQVQNGPQQQQPQEGPLQEQKQAEPHQSLKPQEPVDSGKPQVEGQEQEKSSHPEQKRGALGTAIHDETARVEPLKTKPKKEVKLAEPAGETIVEEQEEDLESRDSVELDAKDDGLSRSRNGTIRNTDSFFRDESMETKKITLTPNLLRDDNQPRPSTDSFSKDLRPHSSFDRLERDVIPDKERKHKKKDDKRDKDRKPSAIRRFFSGKDRKRSEDEDEVLGKRSMDGASELRDSEDPQPDEPTSPEKATGRPPSKLQKQQPRTEPSPGQKVASTTRELSAYLAESRTNDLSHVPPASMRVVDPETQESREIPSHQHQGPQYRSASVAAQRDDTASMLKSMAPRSASATPDSRSQKTIQSEAHMDLDDPHGSEEEAAQGQPPSRPHMPGAFPDGFASGQMASKDRTVTPSTVQTNLGNAESPVDASPLSPANSAAPPGLVRDASPAGDQSPNETPSPELVPTADINAPAETELAPVKAYTWDDDKLRAFFDGGEHVRDLLALVYNKTDVVPVGMDHPAAGGTFREQNAKLAQITTQLDNMLGDWLARKQRHRGTV